MIRTKRNRSSSGELSTFAPLSGGFHQPFLYASLRLPGADFDRYLWKVGRPVQVRVAPEGGALAMSAAVLLTNDGAVSRSYELQASLGTAISTPVSGVLEAGDSDEIEIHVVPVRIWPNRRKVV